MLDQAGATGLVCGYRVDPVRGMQEIRWAEMDAALADAESVVWLHFNQSDVRARDWIERCKHIPSAAKAVLLGRHSHMHVEVCGNGLAGAVGDLHHEFSGERDRIDLLRLYLDSRCLISARRQPLQAIDKLRRAIGDGLTVDRPVNLVAHFLHHVTDTLGELVLDLSEDVDELEEKVIADDCMESAPRLAEIRRVVVRLRRHMVPQQHALFGFAARMPDWIGEADAAMLRAAIERLASLGHDLDLIQDRTRLLSDQLGSRLAEATNRNLYALSIVTTIFLPMTLITGIFGMNLGGLPGQQSESGFWYGVGVMLLCGLITLAMLRRRRLL